MGHTTTRSATGVVWLLVPLTLALVLLAPQAALAATASDGDPPPPAQTAYGVDEYELEDLRATAETEHISLQQAVDQFKLQEAFSEVASRAMEKHADTFAYAAIGDLVKGKPSELWFTAPATPDVRRALARLDAPVHLVEDAPYTDAQSQELVSVASDGVDAAVSGEGISYGVEYSWEKNRIEASVDHTGVAAPSAAAISASITRRLQQHGPTGVDVPAVDVEITEGAGFSATTDEVADGAETEAEDAAADGVLARWAPAIGSAVDTLKGLVRQQGLEHPEPAD